MENKNWLKERDKYVSFTINHSKNIIITNKRGLESWGNSIINYEKVWFKNELMCRSKFYIPTKEGYSEFSLKWRNRVTTKWTWYDK